MWSRDDEHMQIKDPRVHHPGLMSCLVPNGSKTSLKDKHVEIRSPSLGEHRGDVRYFATREVVDTLLLDRRVWQ
eukprot:307177-Alexandrium_andersonii.AAC.1